MPVLLYRQCTGPDDKGLRQDHTDSHAFLGILGRGCPANSVAITVFIALLFSRSPRLLTLAVLLSSALVLGVLIPYLLRFCLVFEELTNGSDQLLNGVAL